MDDTDTAELTSQNDQVSATNTIQNVPEDESTVSTNLPQVPTEPQFPMYKTEKGWNVDVVALARDARDNLDKVRIINIPSLVKKHKIGRQEFEAPTLSEVGGGNKNNFCQVIAGKDGRPVSVDDVHYINTDPLSSNINHGTASVGLGTFFSTGWNMRADEVMLYYEIVETSEYVPPTNHHHKDDRNKQIAQLTCRLVGYEITNWKQNYISIPTHLECLAAATRQRMRYATDYPFYMDIFRITRPDEKFNIIGEEAATVEYLEHHDSDGNFMSKVMAEILDIRSLQYRALVPSADGKRRVDPLRIVETLVLGVGGQFIDITLTPLRNDFQPTTYRLRLTPTNFIDESGKPLIESGLTLKHTSFEKLRMDLESKREKVTIVQLLSLR